MYVDILNHFKGLTWNCVIFLKDFPVALNHAHYNSNVNYVQKSKNDI